MNTISGAYTPSGLGEGRIQALLIYGRLEEAMDGATSGSAAQKAQRSEQSESVSNCIAATAAQTSHSR